MHKQGEGVHDVAVPKVSEVSIVAALSDRGVRNSTRSSNSILGQLRVEPSCQVRHLRNKQHERIRGVFEGEGVHVVALRKVCEVSDVAALSDMGVRISTRSSNSTRGRLQVETSCQARHLCKDQRESIRGVFEGEGVQVVAVRKVCEVSIVAALSYRGVRYSTRSRKSSNGGRPRVEIRVKARQLHTQQLENTLGCMDSALLRAWVRGINRCNRRVFLRHFDRGRKRKSWIKKQAAVKTASRTRA